MILTLLVSISAFSLGLLLGLTWARADTFVNDLDPADELGKRGD